MLFTALIFAVLCILPLAISAFSWLTPVHTRLQFHLKGPCSWFRSKSCVLNQGRAPAPFLRAGHPKPLDGVALAAGWLVGGWERQWILEKTGRRSGWPPHSLPGRGGAMVDPPSCTAAACHPGATGCHRVPVAVALPPPPHPRLLANWGSPGEIRKSQLRTTTLMITITRKIMIFAAIVVFIILLSFPSWCWLPFAKRETFPWKVNPV